VKIEPCPAIDYIEDLLEAGNPQAAPPLALVVLVFRPIFSSSSS